MAPAAHRVIVLWVLALSTVHMMIVWAAGYHYFVRGLQRPEVWGEFYWVLSVQDGTVSSERIGRRERGEVSGVECNTARCRATAMLDTRLPSLRARYPRLTRDPG
jgi:hypothetical protein